MITAERQRELIVQALCYDQVFEYAYGENAAGDSVEIRWVGEEWQIIEITAGQTHISYSKFGFEAAVADMDPEITAAIFDNLELADFYEDELECQK